MSKAIDVKVVEIKKPDPAKERAKEQAKIKADDRYMLTTNNPLVEPDKPLTVSKGVYKHNLERLKEDACQRKNPAHGAIYSAIMGNRYGG